MDLPKTDCIDIHTTFKLQTFVTDFSKEDDPHILDTNPVTVEKIRGSATLQFLGLHFASWTAIVLGLCPTIRVL